MSLEISAEAESEAKNGMRLTVSPMDAVTKASPRAGSEAGAGGPDSRNKNAAVSAATLWRGGLGRFRSRKDFGGARLKRVQDSVFFHERLAPLNG